MTMKRVLLSALLSNAAPMSGDAIAAAQERPAPLVIQAQGSNFPFPEGNMPPALPSGIDTLEGVPVPLDEFMTFTQIPIVMYYGDVIPEKSSEFPGPDHWRTRLYMARLWAEAVNRRGGDVTVVHLPEIGIRGNTHFPFSDLNNIELADLLSA